MPDSDPADNGPHAAGSEPRTEFVLSGQPTGWGAMAKEVREFDEEKAHNCKEDIDTLLVFAGLFSTVLSAFLIAAYPALQPDPMAAMNYNLERIAAQTASYTFNSTTGTLAAATILSSALPPFQAAVNDIRVNVLWFASLIVSLVTASLGMLVKQWLREFSAVDIPSPQARLRLRHYREPMLSKWRVYEIAATLPLLLQLSLGLFFTGLCYFTASVHSTLGHTTIPLVVGWALFFFSATSLPVFFPGCPYKTTLLKVPVAQFHRSLSRLTKQIDLKWSNLIFTVVVGIAFLVLSLAKSMWRVSLSGARLKGKLWRTYLLRLPQTLVAAAAEIPDELVLVENTALDVDILVSVDAIQANDEMLGSTIAEALKDTHPQPEEAIFFVVKILEHRLTTTPDSQRVVPYWPFCGLRFLQGLRPQAREGVLGILSCHVPELRMHYSRSSRNFIPYHELDQLGRAQRAVLFAFSVIVSAAVTTDSLQFCPQGLIPFLQWCLDEEHGPALCRDMLAISNSGLMNMDSHQSDMMRALEKLAVLVNFDYTAGVRCFACIQHIAVLQSGHPNGPRLSSSWDTHWADFDWNTWTWPDSISKALQRSSLEYLCGVVLRGLEHVNELQVAAPDGILCTVLRTTARLVTEYEGVIYPNMAQDIHCILVYALTSTSAAPTDALIDGLLLFDKASIPCRPILHAFADWPSYLDASVAFALQDKGFDRLAKVFHERLSKDDSSLSLTLRLCHVAVFLLVLVPRRGGGGQQWRELFSRLAMSIRSLIPAPTTTSLQPIHETRGLGPSTATHKVGGAAHACLYAMTFEKCLGTGDNRWIDVGGNIHYERWLPGFLTQDSMLPDDMVDILGQLCNKPEDPELFRLRELRDRTFRTVLDVTLTSTPSVDDGHVSCVETNQAGLDVEAERRKQPLNSTSYAGGDDFLNAESSEPSANVVTLYPVVDEHDPAHTQRPELQNVFESTTDVARSKGMDVDTMR